MLHCVWYDTWDAIHNNRMSFVDVQHFAFKWCKPLDCGPKDPGESRAVSRRHMLYRVMVLETISFLLLIREHWLLHYGEWWLIIVKGDSLSPSVTLSLSSPMRDPQNEWGLVEELSPHFISSFSPSSPNKTKWEPWQPSPCYKCFRCILHALMPNDPPLITQASETWSSEHVGIWNRVEIF